MVDVEEQSRAKNFYVIYNIETKKPATISALKSLNIPNGYAESIVDLTTGEEFINGKKHLHKYFVVDNNGIAKFHLINNSRKQKKYYDNDNHIKDLNERNRTFNQLEIKFQLIDDKINLTMDTDLDDSIIIPLINNINSKSKLCKLYITGYGDVNTLICSLEFDLVKLIKDKTLDIELDVDKDRISLWATV
jgi:hypothetical protein